MNRHAAFRRLDHSGMSWAWLGRWEFRSAERLQKGLEQARREGKIGDTLLFLEHPHVYTLGRSASLADVLLGSEECQRLSVAVVQTDRGGQVTYHGPGQLIGYLIVDLRERHLSVPCFVRHIEEGICRWLAQEGLLTERRSGLPGLWYQGRKVVSIGLHISGGISRHGFAVNLFPDLHYYDGIIPCGHRLPISSLEQEVGRRLDLDQAAAQIAVQFDQLFAIDQDSEVPSEAASV